MVSAKIKFWMEAWEQRRVFSSIARSRERGIWKNFRAEVTLELVFKDIPRKVSSVHKCAEA